MFNQVFRKGKSIYVGHELRDYLDKIVLDIGHHIGRPVTVNEFIRYMIEKSADETRDRLKDILGSVEERKQFEEGDLR